MERRVPLSRAAQLLPFLDFLDRLGAPTDRGLERHKLPPGLQERPEMLASTRSMFGFVADMARREGIEDFGWRATAPQLTQMSPRLQGALLRSPSLLHALERMCAGARGESSNVQFWTEQRGEWFFLCHRGSLKLGVLGSDDAATMRTSIIISVMRCFTDPVWVPIECGLAVEGEIGPLVREGLRGAAIQRTPDYGWLRLPRSMLARPPRAEPPVEGRACAEAGEVPAQDLVGSLVQALRPYLPARAPSLHDAAELAGTSARTLQRELARLGSSYRDVLLRVKLDVARELLERPDVKIAEVGHQTGFSDPAHFSRFFRALSGVTPREYRVTHLAGP